MRVPRRLLPLLACALIAGTPAVAHAQGGAGDDQYQDPFGGSGSSSGGGSTSSGGGSTSSGGGSSKSGNSSGSNAGSTGSSAQSSGSSAPELTQDPDVGTSSPAPAATPAPAPSATAGAATSRSELPRTGFDAPIVALLGIGLLAAGLGLRLRVAHGRRS
jgi:LPXTG-motif cell wall-anchored protein